jgi:hypothetical protein
MAEREPGKLYRYELAYKGYPGTASLYLDRKGRWRFILGWGYHYYLAEVLASPGAYCTVDAALDAAIKLFVEGQEALEGQAATRRLGYDGGSGGDRKT